MRKFVIFYFVAIFIMLFTTLFLVMTVKTTAAMIVILIALLFTVVMALPMGSVQWHKTREEMIEKTKDSERIIHNVQELIEKIKKELFRKNILTKEEVSEILDKE